MTAPSGLSAFYKSAPICLWVEDEETKTYLSTAWNGDGAIAIGVANGNSQLKALVDSARKDGHRNVFAFRDRDFTEGNREKWSTVDVFAGSVLEVENYLLDAEAIAASAVNTSGKGANAIEGDMLAFAQRLDWWMACRATITELRDAVTGGFVKHPTWTKVRSQQEAEDAILQATWWQKFPGMATNWDARQITATITGHYARFHGMLATGAWTKEFSGKEIVDALWHKVWTHNNRNRIEFFRSVAESQRILGLPAEVTDLQKTLHARR